MIEIAYRYLHARRALLMACVLAVSCCAVWAQTDGPGGPPPDGAPPGGMQQGRGPSVERQLKQLTQLLTLTTEQQTQVKAILTEQNQKIAALFKQSMQDSASGDDQRPSPEAMTKMRDMVKAIRTDSNTKIAAALTDDQKTKFAAWVAKREKATARQEGDDMPPPPDGEGPPDGGGGPGGGGPPGV